MNQSVSAPYTGIQKCVCGVLRRKRLKDKSMTIPTLCSQCRKEFDCDEEEVESLKKPLCEDCAGIGDFVNDLFI